MNLKNLFIIPQVDVSEEDKKHFFNFQFIIKDRIVDDLFQRALPFDEAIERGYAFTSKVFGEKAAATYFNGNSFSKGNEFSPHLVCIKNDNEFLIYLTSSGLMEKGLKLARTTSFKRAIEETRITLELVYEKSLVDDLLKGVK